MVEYLGTWCPECGHDVKVDEEGLCLMCGCTAVGKGANQAILTRTLLVEVTKNTRPTNGERWKINEALGRDRDSAL